MDNDIDVMDEECPKDMKVAIFGVTCPECSIRRKRNNSGAVYVNYTEEWVHSLVIDCDETGDHVVNISGAWTNPIIKGILARFGLTRRRVLAATAKQEKAFESYRTTSLQLVKDE
jgi:hypothetical protein